MRRLNKGAGLIPQWLSAVHWCDEWLACLSHKGRCTRKMISINCTTFSFSNVWIIGMEPQQSNYGPTQNPFVQKEKKALLPKCSGWINNRGKFNIAVNKTKKAKISFYSISLRNLRAFSIWSDQIDRTKKSGDQKNGTNLTLKFKSRFPFTLISHITQTQIADFPVLHSCYLNWFTWHS